MWVCLQQSALLEWSVWPGLLAPAETGSPEGQDWTKLSCPACICQWKKFNFVYMTFMFLRQWHSAVSGWILKKCSSPRGKLDNWNRPPRTVVTELNLTECKEQLDNECSQTEGGLLGALCRARTLTQPFFGDLFQLRRFHDLMILCMSMFPASPLHPGGIFLQSCRDDHLLPWINASGVCRHAKIRLDLKPRSWGVRAKVPSVTQHPHCRVMWISVTVERIEWNWWVKGQYRGWE